MLLEKYLIRKNIQYAFITSTLAYAFAAILLIIFAIIQAEESNAGTFLIAGITLALSEFEGWSSVSYLAVLVPWLASSLLIVFTMIWFHRGVVSRRMVSGLSICIYYIVMILVLAIGRTVTAWGQIEINPGDIAYLMLLAWPIVGFVLGYLAAMIAERIVKFPVLE